MGGGGGWKGGGLRGDPCGERLGWRWGGLEPDSLFAELPLLSLFSCSSYYGELAGGGGGAVEGSAVTTSAEVHRDAFLVLGHQ